MRGGWGGKVTKTCDTHLHLQHLHSAVVNHRLVAEMAAGLKGTMVVRHVTMMKACHVLKLLLLLHHHQLCQDRVVAVLLLLLLAHQERLLFLLMQGVGRILRGGCSVCGR